MIISHRLKFAFFRVPKTGSTTVTLLLRLCGVFDERDIMSPIMGLPSTVPQTAVDMAEASVRRALTELGRDKDADFEQKLGPSVGSHLMHVTPKDAIKYGLITLEQLREYRVFAFLRDPWDRNFSAASHATGAVLSPSIFKQTIKERTKRPESYLLMRPASMYFYVDGEQVTEPLLFDDFDNEVRRLLRIVGGYEFPVIPRINVGRQKLANVKKEDFFDEEIQQIFQSELADDFELYRRVRAERAAVSDNN